jgi:hypothetical protein
MTCFPRVRPLLARVLPWAEFIVVRIVVPALAGMLVWVVFG